MFWRSHFCVRLSVALISCKRYQRQCNGKRQPVSDPVTFEAPPEVHVLSVLCNTGAGLMPRLFEQSFCLCSSLDTAQAVGPNLPGWGGLWRGVVPGTWCVQLTLPGGRA